MADLTDRNNDVSIHDAEDNAKHITLIADGAIWRLPVQALIDGGTFSLQPFVPVVDFDSTGVALTTAWTTILNFTGSAGKLDFIATSLITSNYKIRLTVDGSEIFDISMADLNAIGLSNATNVSMWAETALKNFRYRPIAPVDFTASVKIEMAMTTGSGTAYYLVNYRTQS